MSDKKIEIASPYAKVSGQAPSAPDSGLSAAQVADTRARLDSFESRIVSRSASVSVDKENLLKSELPKGASLYPNRVNASRREASAFGNIPSGVNFGGVGNALGGNAANTVMQQMRPYQPEFDDISRLSYPVHRILANRYWRLFHKLDPLVGTAIDILSEMWLSKFSMSGEGITGSIKQSYESMIDATELLSILPYFVREFLCVGECVPHTIFDEKKGYWVHIALHNPDQLEVIDAPFLHMDPIIEFVPDDRLRQIVTSSDPALLEVRESLPAELIARIQSGQNIPLDSLNTTYIPRKLHPYDSRGTSILSRLWRTFMWEDAVFTSSLTTSRRHSCFVAGTSVLTTVGLKNIEDVKPGDTVHTGNGKIGLVEAAWEEPPSPTVTIEAVGSENLICTPNHNFPIWKSPRLCACGCGEKLTSLRQGRRSAFINTHNNVRDPKTGRISHKVFEWVEHNGGMLKTLKGYEPLQIVPAGEIEQGDYLLIPRDFEEKDPGIKPEQARILGYYLAEGSSRAINKHNSITWSFALHEEGTWVEDLVKCGHAMGLKLRASINTSPSRLKNGREGFTAVYMDHVQDLWFADWCRKHGGELAGGKVLSEEVMQWPLHLKRELLAGYYRGDGCWNDKLTGGNTHQVSAVSTSKSLIYQIRLILAQLGIYGSVTHTDKSDKTKHPKNWNDTWTVSSTGADARALVKVTLNEIIESPWSDGKESRKGMKTWVDSHYVYVPVQKVTPNSILVPVYNLSVTGDHSYIANGNATRNSPIKVVKLGNERTGWIPGPQAEAKMAELLARAELDPNAYLISHYGVNFEAWGTTDRAMSVTRDLDSFERLKLMGLGIPKSVVIGEVTFASAEKGLQVLLHRLKTMRNMFESKWIMKKYFRGCAKINNWTKISKSESRRNYRIKKNATELQESDYITPIIDWESTLSPRVDKDMQSAIEGLERLGIKISRTTKMSTVAGLSFERELDKIAEENATVANDPALKSETPEVEVKAPMPPADEQEAPAEVPVPMPTAQKEAEDAPQEIPVPEPTSRLSMWDENHVRPLVEFFDGNPDPMIDSEFWKEMYNEEAKAAGQYDSDSKWVLVDEFLQEKGYLDSEIDGLHTLLVQAEVLRDPIKEAIEAVPEDGNLSDKEFNELLPEPKEAQLKKKVQKEASGPEVNIKKIKFAPDTFLSGSFGAPPNATKLAFGQSFTQTNPASKWKLLNQHFNHHGLKPKLTNSQGRFDHNIDAMPWDHPTNQESRTEWQTRLDTSKLPDVVKSRIKYLENAACDHWNAGFEEVWQALNKRLSNPMRLEPESVQALLLSSISSHVDKLHGQFYYDAMADIYAEGKLQSYKPLKFDEIKRKRLKTAHKIAITVDSVSERQVLDAIADSALAKVTDTVTGDVKDRILKALTESGSYSESATELANRIIKEEKEKLQSDTSLSREELKNRVKELYDTQLYNVQRIMRTETINAYAQATLRGYKEQGIVKVKWNAHHDLKPNGKPRTCNICLALDGVEFEVDYLLSLGTYPIAALSHPNCRCYLSPVTVFVSFDEFEKEYEKTHPTEFVPTETIVDQSQISDLSQIIKDIKSMVSEFKGVPAEYEEPITDALKSVGESSPTYSAMMPKEVKVVPDVAATPAFVSEMGEDTAKDMANQVTHYTDSEGISYVSGFAVRDENPSSMVIRTWAESIWDKDPHTRQDFESVYKAMKATENPEDITSASAKKLVEILEPIAVARKVQIGTVEAASLNKKFKNLDDTQARKVLSDAGISSTDAEKIANWREEYILWDLATGGVVESSTMPSRSPFVNDLAALDPEHMFVESMVAYYTSPIELEQKDEELYKKLKSKYFGKQEFNDDLKPGER